MFYIWLELEFHGASDGIGLLGRWPVYHVEAHYGCVQGTCTPPTPFYSVAVATLGFGFCLDSFCHQTVSPFIGL
jgi:hypothetical protein